MKITLCTPFCLLPSQNLFIPNLPFSPLPLLTLFFFLSPTTSHLLIITTVESIPSLMPLLPCIIAIVSSTFRFRVQKYGFIIFVFWILNPKLWNYNSRIPNPKASLYNFGLNNCILGHSIQNNFGFGIPKLWFHDSEVSNPKYV